MLQPPARYAHMKIEHVERGQVVDIIRHRSMNLAARVAVIQQTTPGLEKMKASERETMLNRIQEAGQEIMTGIEKAIMGLPTKKL